jgi:hypothetical protein
MSKRNSEDGTCLAQRQRSEHFLVYL